MNILVTGGAGYIGSHTCVELLKEGHSVIIADNLKNSKEEVIQQIRNITGKDLVFYKIDVTEEKELRRIFSENRIDGVIHFAGLKAVGESTEIPLDYYYNNLVSTMVLVRTCIEFDVRKYVFSSSATVYGDNRVPFVETMEPRAATNPYGETKAMCERILKDTAAAYPFVAITILRYFNPIGAHESGLIGESPNGRPNNIMPFITQTAGGKQEKLMVFGDDYDTPDGTGVRDYIHVVDLAIGHVKAMDEMKEGVEIFNLGTGKGTSVLELIQAFEEETGRKIPYEITERRPGDIAYCYADTTKARKQLGWTTKKDIRDMVRDAWRFEEKQMNR